MNASDAGVRCAGVALLVAVSAAVYAPAIVGPPFYTKGEPREAVVTQRMLARGEYVLGRRSDAELARKPPLFHWLAAAASATAGSVSEATMRIPSLTASLLVIALTTLAAFRAFGTAAGICAGAVLSTSLQWLASSVTARVDMVLAASIAVALLAVLDARVRGAPFPIAFWVGCALAVLAKGPVGYVLPALVIAVHLLVQRDLGYLRTVRWPAAAAISAIPLVWYALAWHRGGEEFLGTVLNENLHRMVDADAGDVGHRHSALYYLPALLAGMAPWSLALPAIAVGLWRRRAQLDEARWFAVVWSVVTVFFFSLAASKRTVYLLAAYPPLALLAGDWIVRGGAQAQPDWLKAAARAAFLTLAFTCILVAAQSAGIPTLELVAPAASPGDRANLVAVAEAMQKRAPAVLMWAALILALGWASGHFATQGKRLAAAAGVAVTVWTTAAFGAATLLRDLAHTQSIKTFVEAALVRLPEGSPLYFYASEQSSSELYFFRSFEYAASFYARRPLTVVHDLGDAGHGPTIWFVAAEPTLRALRSSAAPAAASSASGYSFAEVARYTYGDNPLRTPVVFVEATRGAT